MKISDYLLVLKGQGFEHKGAFDATAVYEKTPQRIDCVVYDGTTYYVKKTAPAGTLPTDTEYFGVLAARGQGGDGEGGGGTLTASIDNENLTINLI